MVIVPDHKDWTWVLARRCPDCGFASAEVEGPDAAAGLRSIAASWGRLAAHPAATRRPRPDRWSALEYACHVRDVYRLGLHRIARMLDEQEPVFANWDQDATAVDDRYDEQDPATVVAELEAAGEALAARLDGVQAPAWQRPGTRSDGARFTVESFARYVLHDLVHHVWDVRQGYEELARLHPETPGR